MIKVKSKPAIRAGNCTKPELASGRAFLPRKQFPARTAEWKQSGNLLISAAILIVIFGLLATTVTYIASTNSGISANRYSQSEALYVASSGIQRAAFLVLNGDLSCPAISGDAQTTNVSFANGTFTITSSLQSASPAPTLSSALSNSNTSQMVVSSIANLTSTGRVMLDREVIGYTGTDTSNPPCSSSTPCLINLTRGMNGTSATSHATGTPVGQRACSLTSIGSLANPAAQSTIKASIPQLDSGWVVGNSRGSNETIGRWNGNTWSLYTNSSSLPNVDYNSLSLLSYGDAWVVGDKSGGYGVILHWNGSQWSRVLPAASVPNANLNGIYCHSANDCFAVGDSNTIIHWGGSQWNNSPVTPPIAGNKNLNAVHCSSSSSCWAVGEVENKDPLLINWNGITWTRVLPHTSTPSETLNGVFCNSNSDCWAVGEKDKNKLNILRLQGGIWQPSNPSPPKINTNLNDVYCTSSNQCWFVGDRTGGSLILRWNGSSWSRMSISSDPNENLFGISCANANDCWASGNNHALVHWNGTSWQGVTPDSSMPSITLNAIGTIAIDHNAALHLTNWKED